MKKKFVVSAPHLSQIEVLGTHFNIEAYEKDDKVLANTETIADGMTLRITAEDGTVNDYSIAVKNDYHWVADYVNAQQGNVWFGQDQRTTAPIHGKHDNV